MATHPLQDFIRRLRRARSVAEGGHLTDAQLLERFAKERDEAAFEVLVWRHGTLVLNVAQRLLRQTADAEDVFQATFLMLARKASAIRRGTSLGSWLYKVAYRLALRARQAAARHERCEQSGIESASAPAEHGDAELSALLAQEVDRLPERYRAVVVLCYLQGATTEEASRLLGCPRGTVLSRLASARQRLRKRLLRRGIAPALALAAVSFGETASAAPAAALVACVVRAALPFAASGAAIPIVSPQAAALAQGALQMMMWNKIKIVAAMVCMIAVVGTGSGWLARGRNAAEATLPAAEPPVKKEGVPAAAPSPADKAKKEIARIRDQLADLATTEEISEVQFDEKMIEARLNLAARQDDLHLQEQEWDFEREQDQDRIKTAAQEIDRRKEKTREAGRTLSPEAYNERRKIFINAEENAVKKLKEERKKFLESERERQLGIRNLRKRVFEAEYELRRLEDRRERQREEFVARRQALLARAQQLEGNDLHLEPADRLRDVERKLDALRREVGELRRALERKKPE
ncbi:MAG TPA: sigma-70 family RNA polymerase sigma factor [Gemmataceae bacterium]|nr:sigma-70 family RNA polymerase sigma factor [Gemmataceae bacterium]